MICRANENDVGSQKEEENKGSAINQQSRELVKKWVRYVENKKWKLRKLTESQKRIQGTNEDGWGVKMGGF